MTLPLRLAGHKRLEDREVSERRQVGDAESLVNQAARRQGLDDSEL